jgi:electron transfer flavoprotein alpha subunit
VLGETKPSGELAGTVFELSGKARELADALAESTGKPHQVNVAVFTDSNSCTGFNHENAARYGADIVTAVSAAGLPFDRARCAKVLHRLASSQNPKIILAAATAFGRSVMPYAAALLGTGLTADCTGLEIEPGTNLLLQTRPAIGGNIIATIRTPNHMPQMATVRPMTFRAQKFAKDRKCRLEKPDIPDELLVPTAKAVSFEPFDEKTGGLREKDVVVSGGKGLRKAEGFELISRLASLLDAGVGASRPAVEMKWIGYPHQVGLSGQVVSPKVYIAAGISGTVQHIAGMQTSGKIVSINRDPDAQIFSVSDVAICGDLYEIIPMLVKKIEERKGLR